MKIEEKVNFIQTILDALFLLFLLFIYLILLNQLTKLGTSAILIQ